MKVITLTPQHETSLKDGESHVMGVAADLRTLADATERWEELGVPFVEVIKGEPGEELLHQREHSFRGFIQSIYNDLAPEMRHQYMQDVADGRIVFNVPVNRDNSEAVVRVAQSVGARHIARYGVAEESYESPPAVYSGHPRI